MGEVGPGEEGNGAARLDRSASLEAKGRPRGAMRKLNPLLGLDDVIWLAGGLPAKDAAFPLTSITVKFKAADGVSVDEVVIDDNSVGNHGVGAGNLYTIQQYLQDPRGYRKLVDWCDEHNELVHGPLPQHKAILSCGSTSSFELVSRILMDKSDTLVVTEKFSFPGFLTVVKNLGVPMVSADMDKGGLKADALEETIVEALAAFSNVKKIVLYMGTCGQNPTGITYKKSRLEEIYAVAKKFDITIIEDDAYMYLNCPGGEPSGLYGLSSVNAGPDDRCSLLSIDTDARVVRMDTFSKFIAPGLRASWVTMPEQYLDFAVKLADNSTRTGSVLSQVVLFEMLQKWGNDGLDAQLRRLQNLYRSRSTKLSEYAEKYLAPENLAEWEVPDCGMFLWMKVNGIEGTEKLTDALIAANIAFGIGNKYMANVPADYPCPYFRISFTSGTDADFEKGMKTLATIIKDYKAGTGVSSAPASGAAASADLQPTEKFLSSEARRRAASRSKVGHFPVKNEETVWLATGLPNDDSFPIISIKMTMYDGNEFVIDDRVYEDTGKTMMWTVQQYGQNSYGFPPLVKWLEGHMRSLHGELPGHKVICSCGTTSSFDLLARMLCDPDETVVLVEEYAFPGFFDTVKSLNVPVVPVEMDDKGMVPEALEEALKTVASGKNVIAYMNSCGQNPTGANYRKSRLEELYALFSEYDCLVLEDDTYMYLLNDGDSPAGLSGLSSVDAGPDDRCSLLSIDKDARVVRMDTFSKFIAPGFRVSWITLPEALLKHAAFSSQNSTKTGAMFAQVAQYEMIQAWGESGLSNHLARCQSYYRARAERLDFYAKKHLSGLAEWEIPECGMFFWMRLKGIDDSAKLLKMLMDEKIAVIPGKFFVADADPDAHYDCGSVRIAFTVASDEEFDRGMGRLKSLLEAFIKANPGASVVSSADKVAASRRRRLSGGASRTTAMSA